jgi:outer membrane immunogenic protein
LILDPSTSGSQGMSGVVGGFQLGYNWQTGNWVWGLEADFDFSSLRSNTVVSVPFGFIGVGAAGAPATSAVAAFSHVTDSHSIDLPWFGTVLGRVGFTPASNWLVYVTGGLAYGAINETNTLTGPVFLIGSHSLLQAGWAVGAGAEWALSTNWSARLEYLYMDFGSFSDTAVSTLASATIDSRLSVNTVLVGFDYRFAPAPPPPIITKH